MARKRFFFYCCEQWMKGRSWNCVHFVRFHLALNLIHWLFFLFFVKDACQKHHRICCCCCFYACVRNTARVVRWTKANKLWELLKRTNGEGALNNKCCVKNKKTLNRENGTMLWQTRRQKQKDQCHKETTCMSMLPGASCDPAAAPAAASRRIFSWNFPPTWHHCIRIRELE